MNEAENEFNPYTDLSSKEYINLVKANNRNNIVRVARDIENYPADETKICFAVTGSDGKLERHLQSKTELIIFYENNISPEPTHRFAEWYEETHGKPVGKSYVVDKNIGLPEAKKIKSDTPLSYFWGQEKNVYPDRTLNATLVMGNQELLTTAKEQVLEEITADTEVGQKIRKKMKAQLKDYRHNLEKGIFHNNQTFTLATDPPLQFYDERQQSYTVGFKASGLRSVQRELDLATIHAIRSGEVSIKEAVKFPTNTINRIDEFKKRKIIPKELPIEDSYSWFLRRYHMAQEKYRQQQSAVASPFPKDEFLQHKRIVLEFLDLSRGKPL